MKEAGMSYHLKTDINNAVHANFIIKENEPSVTGSSIPMRLNTHKYFI